MRKVLITTLVVMLSLTGFYLPTSSVSYALSGSVLFDNAHLQTAGNADWTITGGYSDFANALKSEGLTVNAFGTDDSRSASHDHDDDITYDVLKNYDVYIIPEPNDPFTTREQDAILTYIENGGTVFFIADHSGADRNHNGYDAVKIFNAFVPTLGFKFLTGYKKEAPMTGPFSGPFMEGISKIGAWGASSIKVLNDNVKVAATYSDGSPYIVYGTYGKGGFVAIGDSSPFDDGTGAPGDRLHDGWSYGDDSTLAINIVNYLLSLRNSGENNTLKILLVDDDGGADYETYYEDALDALNISYDVVEVPEGQALSGVFLKDYDAVIWFTGEDYKTTLLSSDRKQIADYVNSGGKFILFGPDVGYNAYRDGWEDFLRDVFRAEYADSYIGDYVDITGDYYFDGLSATIDANDSWITIWDTLSGGYDDIDSGNYALEVTTDNTMLFGFGLEHVSGNVSVDIMKGIQDFIEDR